MTITLETHIREKVADAINNLYQASVNPNEIQTQQTRKDFSGDLTVVVFPFLKASKKTPEKTAEEIGNYLCTHIKIVSDFNVIKGFLNLTIENSFWSEVLQQTKHNKSWGKIENQESKTIMIEYSSPNTNKPLHLGHIRNNLIGFSLSEILKAAGNNVIKVNLVNDRGIHICKSMLAWQKFGNGETPESTGMKGDHLVGKYYVMFDQAYKRQIAELQNKGISSEEASKKAPIIIEAQEMLRAWESGDEKVVSLWETMNGWVYKGFEKTYKQMGVDFDKIYYESQTYKLGKSIVLEGKEKGILNERADSSIWANLTGDGLDEKLLLRSDGTSVYMTQDIGTAHQRFSEFKIDEHIYVVGNEQNYHFQVLKLILKKLGYNWSDQINHLSYGMVELPEGKMKSREGTVVDADDLMEEMITTAREMAMELGKLDDFSESEKKEIYRIIGLGALKYFILKVDPRKNMVFDPRESIDFNGNTGPFIQYTYARIRSIFRKAVEMGINISSQHTEFILNDKEKLLVKTIYNYSAIVQEAAQAHSPALIANYLYDLVKEYNQFYHDYLILKETDENQRNTRLVISEVTGKVIKSGMGLLGIEVPERM